MGHIKAKTSCRDAVKKNLETNLLQSEEGGMVGDERYQARCASASHVSSEQPPILGAVPGNIPWHRRVCSIRCRARHVGKDHNTVIFVRFGKEAGEHAQVPFDGENHGSSVEYTSKFAVRL